jgi:low temperature requirement protein LtrA
LRGSSTRTPSGSGNETGPLRAAPSRRSRAQAGDSTATGEAALGRGSARARVRFPDGHVVAAVVGFTAVATVWWLYFDRQGSVALRGSTMSVVVYSYAHIPLLMGLAAMSAGLRMLIERADSDHLGTAASVAFLGGPMLFVLSLIGTRTVVVGGPHRLGVSIKLVAVAIILGLLLGESALPPIALAAGLVLVLATLIYMERTLTGGEPESP